MSRFIFQYNVKNRNREGNGRTWVIKDIDSGEEFFTNHIEIKTAISTNEKTYDERFGMYVENCKLEYREHESIGSFIVIVKEIE